MRHSAIIGSVAAAAMLAACGGQDDSAENADAEAQAEMAAAEAEAGAEDAAAADAAADIEIDPDATPAERNLAMGEAFLDRNAARDGVTVTDSGLQYEVLEAAPDGAPTPTVENWVCVHYTGSLIDGTEFDSTRDDGKPVVLPRSGLIEGWQEALSIMPEGARWNLYVPANLGYRQYGAYDPNGQEVIPPNAALVFDMQLLRALEAQEIAVLPGGRVDPSWDCSQTAPVVEDE